MKIAFEVYTEHDKPGDSSAVLYAQTDFQGNWEICNDGSVFFNNEVSLADEEVFLRTKAKPHSTNKRDYFICRAIGTQEWTVVDGNMTGQGTFKSLADAFDSMINLIRGY